ncbi:glucokinase [Fulvimarina endophytica]|uniref:Glucokinase n=2 Tax=Fulvimarina endophytica TaxID=2293836 RepID=A0A371X1S6_9HYPH|nr:glucokinase [Fulvimarina endophytica]
MAPRRKPDTFLKFPILIGDIGGTNARFAILKDAFAEPKFFDNVETASFASIDAAIQECVLDQTSVQPKSAVLAIAGPIDGDELDLTNCPWVIRPKGMIADLGLEEVVVINDFEAQALAISAIGDGGRAEIGNGIHREGASRAVIGPGTGLGVAGLVRARNMWIPVAGEGGHIDIGPRTERDHAIWPHLATVGGRISGEQILSGRGLVNLYNAICKSAGKVSDCQTPAEVTRAAEAGADPQAKEAIELFSIYLGRIAGDIALVFIARGGVYIAGGIFKRLLPLVDHARMREAFEDKAPHTHLMSEIPLYVITEPQPALAGLTAFARSPRFFGLETTGRHWKA